MAKTSYLIDLSCTTCGKHFPSNQPQTYCHDCNATLLANYDFTRLKQAVDRDQFRCRPKGMWRWYECLPVRKAHSIVTLGEGDTPLLRLTRLGHTLGLLNLYIKEEGINPTGSFKARGVACAVSKAQEHGITKLVIPSAGNAGGALAAYAAQAGMDALIYMPKSSPNSNISESIITGARVELVDGLIDQAGKLANLKTEQDGWFNMATFKEPYRVEGKKIMGYEIAESLGWRLPDVIIYPTGGGTGLGGMWKACQELASLSWLEERSMPRMMAVQAEGCAPVVKAFDSGVTFCEPWIDAQPIATGLCVPKSFADPLILRDIQESNGMAISVSDEEIRQWQGQLARTEGLFACPEGAATLAGLVKLIHQGSISKDETVVIFNTASGIKYN
ncbi:MAG: threonine synthase [Anaerolineae bacterium]|nr:threonine synthase [Anaerolineae bacterium]